LLWFFGLHGTNIMSAILDGTYVTALQENATVWEQTRNVADFPYMWTRGSFDAYAWQGGAGLTIALLLAILVFSKRQDHRTIAKLATPMGVFNINEPVVFGLPVVLNPLFVIPWILVPVITATIGWVATAIGFVPPVYIQVPWIIPPVIYALMATGFSWTAALVSLINIAIGFAIYSVFVLVANKMDDSDNAVEAEAEK
jgi:PTS system cellobiose-specific IIC component